MIKCFQVGVSYIELEKNLSPEEMAEVEFDCNEAIRKHIDVVVKFHQKGDPELSEAHTRGLPADFSGPIRVIHIQDYDSNMCCGTHVSNLAHLQAVKLLSSENRKGKVFLNFLVGSRVLKYLDQCR